MKKVIYHAAVSVDGFMARKDGSIDCFSMDGPHVDDFLASFEKYDTAIMGRNTYELGVKMGVTDPYPNMNTYVFSKSMKKSPNPKVSIVAENAGKFVKELKQGEGKDIWVVGAGDFASTLFDEQLIDELTVKINPILIGEGISLVKSLSAKHIKLILESTKTYDNGVSLHTYKVV